MVVNSTSHRGLYEWLVQRVTAIIIGVYTFFLWIYFLLNPTVSYSQWHALFHYLPMKLATFVVVFSMLWHAWIGLWTVFTDYIKPRSIRVILEATVIVLLLAYLAWTIEIMWG